MSEQRDYFADGIGENHFSPAAWFGWISLRWLGRRIILKTNLAWSCPSES